MLLYKSLSVGWSVSQSVTLLKFLPKGYSTIPEKKTSRNGGIILEVIKWGKCIKFDFKQLFHSIHHRNIIYSTLLSIILSYIDHIRCNRLYNDSSNDYSVSAVFHNVTRSKPHQSPCCCVYGLVFYHQPWIGTDR